jgi:hypothetical protein
MFSLSPDFKILGEVTNVSLKLFFEKQGGEVWALLCMGDSTV